MKYLALSLLLVAAPAVAAPAIRDTSYREPDGARVQQLEIVVPVPPAKVWTPSRPTPGSRAGPRRWRMSRRAMTA
ncbi:MAG: hypothetical protein WDN08_15485 [Rhizomicrobium sp.]